MKSLAELEAIRQKTLDRITMRGQEGTDAVRVVVGLATCGIAAGARPVFEAFENEVKKLGLKNVTVSQTGCIGMCRLEPMVDVYLPGKEKVTYIRMTPEKAARVVAEHVAKGSPVEEFTIGAVEM